MRILIEWPSYVTHQGKKKFNHTYDMTRSLTADGMTLRLTNRNAEAIYLVSAFSISALMASISACNSAISSADIGGILFFSRSQGNE